MISREPPSRRPNSLRIRPCGGCGEFGMNLTVYDFDDQVFLVDAGVMFPEQRYLGVSSIIPDITEIVEMTGSLTAYVITHGHEDHIGALPHLLKRWNVPVYATEWTSELISKKLYEHNLLDKVELNTVRAGQTIKLGDLEIEYLHVNHSIPDACALLIKTPDTTVFHTGDFKFDNNPPDGKRVDFDRLKEIGNSGVDLLLADSTNASTKGWGLSETTTYKPLLKLVEQAQGRVFITTFASNLFRLVTIAKICVETNRKLFLAGRGIETTFAIAARLDMFQVPEGLLVDKLTVGSVEDSQLVILASGSQGEWRSALSRIASGEHKQFKIKSEDLVIFSSRVIPGNEKSILGIKNRFEKCEASIIDAKMNPEIHVSGHAHQDELDELIRLLNPKCYLPVHGTISHLMKNREIGRSRKVGEVSSDEIIEDGSLIELKGSDIEVVGYTEINRQYIDQDSYMTISHETLRERLRIGELGLAVLTGIIDRKGKWVQGPDLLIQGLEFPLSHDFDKWLEKLKNGLRYEVSQNQIDNCDSATINENCRILVRRSLTKVFTKKPVVFSRVYGI